MRGDPLPSLGQPWTSVLDPYAYGESFRSLVSHVAIALLQASPGLATTLP
jgi:hypothetical protein